MPYFFLFLEIFSVVAHESKGLLHLSETIFSHLGDADICSMRLVCKKFQNFIDDQEIATKRFLEKQKRMSEQMVPDYDDCPCCQNCEYRCTKHHPNDGVHSCTLCR